MLTLSCSVEHTIYYVIRKDSSHNLWKKFFWRPWIIECISSSARVLEIKMKVEDVANELIAYILKFSFLYSTYYYNQLIPPRPPPPNPQTYPKEHKEIFFSVATKCSMFIWSSMQHKVFRHIFPRPLKVFVWRYTRNLQIQRL